MARYSFGGLTLIATESIAGLEPQHLAVAESPLHVVFEVADLGPCDATWQPHDGIAGLLWRRTESAFLLADNSSVQFHIRDDGGELAVHRSPSADVAAVAHLLVDQVLPRWIASRGYPVLHASGVRHERHGVALFLGQSGTGKSSLASSFGEPCQLLGDDCFVLDISNPGAIGAQTSYPSLRLLPDSLAEFHPTLELPADGEKARVAIAHGSELGSDKVAAMFMIDGAPRTGAPAVERLGARDAAVALVRNSFRLNTSDPASLTRAFENAELIANEIPVFDLQYERRFDQLGAVHELVLATLDESRR